jgi:hypothetical protein
MDRESIEPRRSMDIRSKRAAVATLAAAALAIAVACGGSKSPVAPAPTCTFAVSVTSAQVPAAGQAMTVHVETAAACAWTARTPAGWITLSAGSGTGAADIVVTIGANEAASERTAAVTIAEREIAIRQDGRTPAACTFALESSSSTFGASGGPGRLSVRTAEGCAWTARSLAPWITLRVATGAGPGTIEYDVASFTGTAQRETRIVVDQASFAVRQDPPAAAPCTYAVDPTATSLHWHGTVGDGFDVRITTAGHCSWTAAAGASWLELLTPAAGTGSATARARVGAYTLETTRSAPLMIRWPTDTAGQNVWVTQEGCYYALSITSDAVPAAGGRRRVAVFGTPVTVSCALGCPWTVASSASWLRIPGATSRAGDDDLFYDVDPNTTGAPRTATLTIGRMTLVVTQGS